MAQLRVKNVGPITNGLTENDGWLNFDGVTFFIGGTASGKSTLAKLFSTLSWIEKALVKEEISIEHISKKNSFVKYLTYQKIADFIKLDSEINYLGDAFKLNFSGGKFSVSAVEDSKYLLPKIMYYPAERSLLSIIDKPEKLKGLPESLYTFLYEYDKARNHFFKGYSLPFVNAKYEYNKQNKLGYLSNGSFKIRLSEAASGVQTALPMLMVVEYLQQVVEGKIEETNNISLEQIKLLSERVLDAYKQPNLDGIRIRNELSHLLNKTAYGKLIHIIEEPELNLYPNSQKILLYKILENSQGNNRLVITTHSPYLISYLALAIKAFTAKIKFQEIPQDACVNPKRVNIYELKSGEILRLSNVNGIPDDGHLLNQELDRINDIFFELQSTE